MIKLISKERIGGRIKRKYDRKNFLPPLDGFRYNIKKRKTKNNHQSLNLAELKRISDKKLDNLYRI
ncbi:hypothetical protein K0B03_00465 [Patescibacteria group bacterium]|nr:hypothetical protein [Patescibacteria group bacterium]